VTEKPLPSNVISGKIQQIVVQAPKQATVKKPRPETSKPRTTAKKYRKLGLHPRQARCREKTATLATLMRNKTSFDCAISNQ